MSNGFVYRCHCPRCKQYLESSDTFYLLANFHCDGCGCEFHLGLEWAERLPASESMYKLLRPLVGTRD